MTATKITTWDGAAHTYQSRRLSRTWHSWMNRQPTDFRFDSTSHDREYWTRGQFRAALRAMPKDEPGRWRFKVGLAYADKINTRDEPYFEAFYFAARLFLTTAFVVLSLIFPFVGFLPIVWVPIVAVGGVLVLWWVRHFVRWLIVMGR